MLGPKMPGPKIVPINPSGAVSPQVVVTGSNGRIGRLLRLMWQDGPPARLIWTARGTRAAQDLAWNLGVDAAPPMDRDTVILHLAGVLQGTTDALAANHRMTAEMCHAATVAGVRHVLLISTAAVYAPQRDLDETADPAPVSDYGRAKLAGERVAQRMLPADGRVGLTVLRLGNLAGADALLGGLRPGVAARLDPVAGQAGGPLRSYVGPQVLARVLAELIEQTTRNAPLPRLLNVAQPGAVAMADLLTAAGHPWHFGPPDPAVRGHVDLRVDRLAALLPAGLLPDATATGIVADLLHLKGKWP